MSLLFIDTNNFIGEINLDLNNSPDVLAGFEALGRQIEDDVLKDLLGDKLFTQLMDDLDTQEEPQTQPYIDLVDGVTYTNDANKTIIYQGLKRLLRYFVWEEYLLIQHSINASTGQQYQTNENSTLLSRSALRKVRAPIQNKAVSLYGKAVIFINDNYTDYFTNLDYGFWTPKRKKFLGRITTDTYSNKYFYNRSSEGN